eukprot:311435_1
MPSVPPDYETIPMKDWTKKNWCHFIKKKKVGNQNTRMIPQEAAKAIIKEIKTKGGMTGSDFSNLAPQQMKEKFGLDDVDCNRFQEAKKILKVKQQETQQANQQADISNAWPTTGELTINVVLDNGRTDTITAHHYWTVGDLKSAIKRYVSSVPSAFDLLIAGKRFTVSESS